MKICCCCGGRMNLCSPRNPNICLDCEALTLDDSPLLLASQTEAASAPQESAGHWSSERASAQEVLAGSDPNGSTETGCTIDGVPIGPPSSYRVSSPQFRFDAPTPWMNSPAPGGKGKAVGDGYYVLAEPLAKGDHTIHFGGAFHFNAGDVPQFGPDALDFSFDMTYHVRVR